MEDFMEMLEDKYGIDEQKFKMIVVAIVAVVLLIGGYFAYTMMNKIKVLPTAEMKAMVQELWVKAQAAGATTEEQYRKYIMSKLKKVSTKEYFIDVTPEGVTVTAKRDVMNKYGFYYEQPYEYRVVDDKERVTKYAIVFHSDGSADTYTGDVDTGYVLFADQVQSYINLKFATIEVSMINETGTFSASGLVLTLGNFKPTVTYNTVHGIYRDYTYSGIVSNEKISVTVNGANKATIVSPSGTQELQIRFDTGEHRIISEGKVLGVLSLDGKQIMLEKGTLKIEKTPYKLNVETLKYPGMKVKLVEDSTVEGVKAGKPKTGDMIVYNDYTYVCNQHFDGKSWVTFNEDENNPQWGVRVNATTYASYPDVESEIFGVPVTSMRCTFYNCSYMTYAPKVSTNTKDMTNTFTDCTGIPIAPKLPNGVITLEGAFDNCRSLVTAPTIPTSVKNMNCTFFNCRALTAATKIPENVVDVTSLFEGCRKLTGTIRIDSKLIESFDRMFNDTRLEIRLGGNVSDDVLIEYAKTANYNNVYLHSGPIEDDDGGFTDINQ